MTGTSPTTSGTTTNYARTFGYDAYGNMALTYASGILPPGNTPSVINSAPWPYNSNNQFVSGTYDQAGNETVVNGNTVTYDFEGRQTSVVGAGVNETYIYDGDGKRVGKVSTAAGSPTSVFVYDALGRMAAEYENTVDTPNCVTCYLSADHLGTARLVTDQSGNVVSRHDYLPFGEEILAGQAGRGTAWGPGGDSINQKFTGKERDSESGLAGMGLDYFGARYYGSGLGRFISHDRSRLSIMPNMPQTWNQYTYVNNNSLRYKDDNGKWPTEIHNQIIDKAFPNLSAEQRQILKNISATQDGIFNGGQSEGRSPEHAMSSDSQSWSAAFNQFSSFVSTWETEAQLSQSIFWLSDPDTAAQTQSPDALAAFGMALHAYEDSTSPAHEGFQTWRWYDIPGFIIHHFRENSISPEQMRRAVAIARSAFLTTFGVDIRDAGDGATVSTFQGPLIPCGGNTGNPCPK